jgi:hypothetical protein
MATRPLTPIVFGGDLTIEWQDIYTVEDGDEGIGIDAAVFNNYSTTTATFSIRLVQVGAAGVLNEIITEKNIRAKSNDLAPAMIGQALVTGGIIQAKASADNSISVNITATIVTS